MSDFKLSADDDLKGLFQRVAEAPKQLQDSLRQVGQSARGGSGGEGPGTGEQARKGYEKGAEQGRGIAQDVQELREGGFENLIGRRVKMLSDMAKKAQEKRKDDERAKVAQQRDMGLGGGGPATMLAGSQSARAGGGASLQRMTVNQLVLSGSAARSLGMGMARGQRMFGGGMMGAGVGFGRGGGGFGRGVGFGGGGGGGGVLGSAGAGIGRAGAGLPFAGAIMGIVGAYVSGVSALAKAHSAVMEAQSGTIDVLKGMPGASKSGFVSAGGVLPIAEKAQAMVARMREGQESILKGDRDIRMGLLEGIGGVEGARLGAQMRRSTVGAGGLGEMLGLAQMSGFQRTQRAEFIRQISDFGRQQVVQGFAPVDRTSMARMSASLVQRGINRDASLPMLQRMTQTMQQQGGPMHGLAIAAAMNQPGTSAIQALAAPERGAAANLPGIAKMLGLEQMGGTEEGRQMRAFIESRGLGAGTLTQALAASGSGGLLAGLGQDIDKQKMDRLSRSSVDELDKMTAKQEVVRRNKIDTLFAGSAGQAAANQQVQLTGQIVDLLKTLEPTATAGITKVGEMAGSIKEIKKGFMKVLSFFGVK